MTKDPISNRLEILMSEAKKLSSSVVSDKGMGRANVLDHKLINFTPNIKLIGPVHLVKTDGDILPVLQGLDSISPGYILLIEDSIREEALLGDIIMLAAVKKGVKGLLCSGKIRDISEADNLGISVWAESVSPKAAGLGKFSSPVESVMLAGVKIESGDWLFGDQDGLVHVPANDARLIIKSASIKDKKERIYKQRMENGEKLIEMMNVRKHVSSGEAIKVDF